jgi:hypothetical protein
LLTGIRIVDKVPLRWQFEAYFDKSTVVRVMKERAVIKLNSCMMLDLNFGDLTLNFRVRVFTRDRNSKSLLSTSELHSKLIHVTSKHRTKGGMHHIPKEVDKGNCTQCQAKQISRST